MLLRDTGMLIAANYWAGSKIQDFTVFLEAILDPERRLGPTLEY